MKRKSGAASTSVLFHRIVSDCTMTDAGKEGMNCIPVLPPGSILLGVVVGEVKGRVDDFVFGNRARRLF